MRIAYTVSALHDTDADLRDGCDDDSLIQRGTRLR